MHLNSNKPTLTFSSSILIGTENVMHISVFCAKHLKCPSNSSATSLKNDSHN